MIEIDGILFDMDGVLIDSMSAHADAWIAALGELGLSVDETEIYLREGEKGEVSAKDFLRQAGMMSTKARVRTVLERKEAKFAERGVIRPFPAAEETIAALAGRGVPIGLVTGTSRGELERVLPPAIKDAMDVVVTGDQVLHGKPHPEPYLKGVMGLQTRAGRTLVVENAPYGIQSAIAAETVCLAVRSYLADEHLAAARYRIDTLADLLPWLRANAAGYSDLG